MAEPFSASTAFTNSSNNNNNDGWGDDWGDWGDNSNAAVQQQSKAAPAPQQPAPINTNQYFQQKQPQFPHLDQSNRNFIQNPASHPGVQPPYQNYGASVGQSHFQTNYQQQPYVASHQQLQPFGQAPAPTNYFNQQPQSHPVPSTTPQSSNQNITEMFNTSAGDNWNWNATEHQAVIPSPKPAEVPQHPPPSQHQLNAFQDQSYPQQTSSPNNFSIPGAGSNTQPPQLPPKALVPQLARLKNETLSPQWSIESQVSQTSSDRSIESAEIAESRSSHTIPSDDGSSGRVPRAPIENYEHTGSYNQFTAPPPVDKLDEALSALNIKPEPQLEASVIEQDKRPDSYRESSFPPPPPSIVNQQSMSADGGILPPKSSSQTPPLPPPPSEQPNQGPPQGPPPSQGPLKGPAGNPFKRVGQRSHIATPGIGVAQPSPSSNFFYQPPIHPLETTNVENPTPENQEIPGLRVENFENLEVAPSNDRNQYLQTGHLSEEGYASGAREDQQQPPGDDSLPPPGLSRYVPGQQQQPDNNQQLSGHSFPPPGLDRMIPGTDLDTVIPDLNMERQIDGEVSDSASTPIVRSSAAGDHHHGSHHHGHRQQPQEEISDRNLYLVPGESDNAHHTNAQRVIPGVEDDRPSQVNYVPLAASPVVDIPINEQQRELIMDGENPHDPPAVPIHVEISSRDEPIEGANTCDEPINNPNQSAVGITETDSNLTVDSARKDPSNTSTADESDKERSMFYGKGGKGGRRDEDPLRRSTKSKSSRDRYDTEDSDYSDRERRRREREGSAGVDAVNRERRRGGDRDKEKDRRKDGGRDRGRDREYDHRDRDYDYRDRDRNRYDRERDRYGGGRSGGKYERDDRRYETDGSKYDAERSTRYDRDGDGSKRYMSREEYYRKREEKAAAGVAGEDDRRYRKEKDRPRGGGDRYRDERRKDDRYREGGEKRRDRRYDYEDYRTGSRNGTERDRERDRDQRDRVRDSRERDERDPRKDRKYPPSASGAVPYGAPYGAASGYYDPYSYYTQHQQYYEQLRRTNPQAYAEWYRTYYSQIQASQMQRDLMTSDGRESVHSGRSSANDKERYNRTTPFLHQQGPAGLYNPDDYHRHFNNQSQPSAMLDQSFLSDVSGQPVSLPPLYQHHASSVGAFQHQQQQQQHQQHRVTPLAMDRSFHTVDSGYYQPRLDNTDGSLRQEPSTITMMEPERLTPRKFPEIHPIVSVSSGLLVATKNRLTVNGSADVVKIFSLGTNEPTRRLFQSYPGPLGKDRTHKKSVIEFCEEQLRIGPPCVGGQTLMKSRGNSINSLHSLGANVSRGSFTLLWNYIILLLRQNGTFVGTDISELLMQNKVEFPFESPHTSARSTNLSGRNSSLSTTDRKPTNRDSEADGQIDDDQEDRQENAENVSSETEPVVPAVVDKKEPLSELEITEKFRNYLIYGNISDALEWATENNLWGHALFLASKVDSRQHANVMMKFANKLTLNDPLQTLYQLLSGRTPSAVSCVQDEKWGDWRPHLAMLMSNSSAKPELIKKSITTLGDSLYNRGDLYAAHFCYLLSDVTFGRFSDVKQDGIVTITASTAVRLILLGSSHLHRSFREFATNESIMMTEIYEYARSLNEDRYSIAELQFYKYLLACRMLDYGMQLKCLLYMEQIADQIQGNPYRFGSEFIKKVYTLGDRLKFYDPVLEKALDESVDNTGRGNIYANVEDPAWLQRLSAILTNYNPANVSYQQNQSSYDGSLQQDYSSSQFTSYVDYPSDQQSQQPLSISQEQQSYGGDSSDINRQFAEINNQFDQLNLQYMEGFDRQQHQQQQQQQQPTPTHTQQQQFQQDHQTGAPSYDQGYDSINQPSLTDESSQQPPVHPHQESYDHQQHQSQQQPQQPFSPYGAGGFGESGQPGMFIPAAPSAAAGQDVVGQPNPYDYWGANAEVPKPTISMPNAISNRAGFDDEEGKQPNQNQQSSEGQATKSAPNGGAKKGPQPKDGKQAPIGQNANSGWFGGIWNKFSLKPKNQMILPDDKNPTIVWDPEKKRWINTEEGEAGEEAFKPPPKITDLMPSAGPAVMPPHSSPTPVPPAVIANPPVNTGSASVTSMNTDHPMAGGHQPATINPMSGAATTGSAPKAPGEPTKVPNLQSNMFKMQRNRTLKQSYVNVFNPPGAVQSKAPTEPILAPAVPPLTTPQSGFFIPGPAPMGVSASNSQGNDNSTEGMPSFYNPNQFAGGYQQ